MIAAALWTLLGCMVTWSLVDGCRLLVRADQLPRDCQAERLGREVESVPVHDREVTHVTR